MLTHEILTTLTRSRLAAKGDESTSTDVDHDSNFDDGSQRNCKSMVLFMVWFGCSSSS